jgi:hypothetical protein
MRRPDWVAGVLQPLPFRGDLIAAGAVALATGILLIDVRMHGAWAAGVRLVVVGLVAALLLALAWRAPIEGAAPRAYVSVLLAAAFPLTAVTLAELADALGGSPDSAGSATWGLATLAAIYLLLAVRRNSALSTLLGAVSAVAALLAFWAWVFEPEAVTPDRWLLLAAIVVLTLGAVRLRDGRRRHAVALIEVAGLSALAIAATSLTGGDLGAGEASGWGWKLVLLLVGFGLIAYGAADREPGPAWLGAFVLLGFIVLDASPGSLLWGPLLLVVLGAGAVAAGLRPTRPTPPAPDADAPPAATRPFDPGLRG